VVLWDNKLSPLKKFHLGQPIQGLSFNPITNVLFAVANQEYAFMNYEKNILEKKKEKQRILCCNWSPDGLYIAYGCFEGICTIRD